MHLFDLTGKAAIVTGGCAGLGRSFVEGLQEAGAEVAIIDISPEVVSIAAEMSRRGPQVHGIQGDLADRQDLERAFEAAVAALGGRLDILVNNAGIVIRHKAEEFPLADWDRVIDLNLNAVFHLCQLAARIMIPQGSGKIINIASMLSYFGGILVCSYAASKGAIGILTRALGNEWASKGIQVNAIAPGYMDTALNAALKADPERSTQILARIPAGDWGDPQDLKGPVVFLASAASNYMSGAIIPVDGGYLSR